MGLLLCVSACILNKWTVGILKFKQAIYMIDRLFNPNISLYNDCSEY